MLLRIHQTRIAFRPHVSDIQYPSVSSQRRIHRSDRDVTQLLLVWSVTHNMCLQCTSHRRHYLHTLRSFGGPIASAGAGHPQSVVMSGQIGIGHNTHERSTVAHLVAASCRRSRGQSYVPCFMITNYLLRCHVRVSSGRSVSESARAAFHRTPSDPPAHASTDDLGSHQAGTTSTKRQLPARSSAADRCASAGRNSIHRHARCCPRPIMLQGHRRSASPVIAHCSVGGTPLSAVPCSVSPGGGLCGDWCLR